MFVTSMLNVLRSANVMIFDVNNLDTDWVRAMRQSEQSPKHHGEGDVWTHTLMVCDELKKLSSFQEQPKEVQEALYAAAVLHDCAKPDTFAKDENGTITNKNHAPKGAIKARRILWEMDVPFKQRELICNLIKYHMRPFHLLDSSRMDSYVAQISVSVRTDLLAILATADTLGRHAPNKEENLEQLQVFEEYCKEQYCWGQPFPFASDNARVAHFNDGQDILSQSRPPLRPCVIVMSGLPGSGKDTWIKEHFSRPVISLDNIRKELRLPPYATGEVIQVANKRAKRLLAERTGFIWNATNVSKRLRNKCLTMFRQYRALIHIIYVETDCCSFWHRNKTRPDPVPHNVLKRLLDKWEVPDLTEAHDIRYVVPPNV